MELNYSGAKTIEEKLAIKKAFWDQLHREVAEGKWRPITREEFERQVKESVEAKRRLKEQRTQNQPPDQQDNPTPTP